MIIQPFQGCAQSNGGFCPSSSIQSHNYILSLCDHGMEWEMRGLEIGPWSTSIFLNCSSRQVDLTPTSCELSSLISTVPTDVYVCPRSLAWIVQILLGSFGSVYYIPQPVCLSRPSEQLTDQAQILFTLRAPKPFLGVLFSPYPWVEGIGGGNERVSSQRPTPVANCNALFDIIFPHPHSFGKLTLVLYLLTNSAIADVKYKL